MNGWDCGTYLREVGTVELMIVALIWLKGSMFAAGWVNYIGIVGIGRGAAARARAHNDNTCNNCMMVARKGRWIFDMLGKA